MRVQTWKKMPLNEAFWFQEGPGVRKWQFTNSGIKLLNVANITKRGTLDLDKTARHLSILEIEEKYNHFLADEGDLVIASSGISFDSDNLLRTRGAFVEKKHLPLCMNTSTIRFKAKKTISNLKFLKFWLDSQEFRTQITRYVTGSAQQNFGPSHLNCIEITLPPLEEQQRIAAILDKADALRDKRRQAIAKLDTLLQSVFLDMFGDPVTNPKGWRIDQLGNCASFVGGGTPSRANPTFYEGKICWATSKDMKGEFLHDTQEHITENAISESATKLVPAGTILVVVKSKILMKHLPVMISLVPTCFGQDLKGIILNDGALTKYIVRHLRIGQRTLLERARGVNTEGLTLEHLSGYRIMLPPKNQIMKFDSIETKINALRIKALSSEKQLDNLFNSLQLRAFNGELFNTDSEVENLLVEASANV